MIREHAFNCRWWGRRVGIVEDPAFFSAPESTRRELLAPFEWVEFRRSLETDSAPDPWLLRKSGFAQVDTQLKFRLALKRLPAPVMSGETTVVFADAEPFTLSQGDLPEFRHERFRHLPGATAQRVADRYEMWAAALLEQSPEWCVEVRLGASAQGWFLAEPEGEHLHLALAMLRRDSALSGMELYRAALDAFSRRASRGQARFSIENRAVLNIYSRLGATFVDAIGCWLWTAA